ncbi:MAG: hypothetical protein L0Y58_06900, partial [Verrucomicrobia subdivision 3 bacterium]|nr:hypothetical protein [Limisphaerales bacterium]
MKLPLLLILTCVGGVASGAEPWADRQLPLSDALELWLDASRERAARETNKLAAPMNGNAIDCWHDGSGHKRHCYQRILQARPLWRRFGGSACVYFDGETDFLAASAPSMAASNWTILAVVAPHSNPGVFRGFVSANARGKNDYQSGLNIDLGGAASTNWSKLNVEGAGMSGERDLLSTTLEFPAFQMVTVLCGDTEAVVRINGSTEGKRGRKPIRASFDEMTVGARNIDTQASAPYAQSFFHGDIAELLLFSRRLSETDVRKIEEYLARKHVGLLRRSDDPAAPVEVPLAAVPNPPPVQVLVPGFAVRELPLKLKNINNLVYAPDGRLFALGYNGNVWRLTDSDGDGLEDTATLFWDNARGEIPASIGMAWGPRGLYIPTKGRIIRLRDTGSALAELETVNAGWPQPAKLGGTTLDAVGIAVDREGNVYFGLGADEWSAPYRIDEKSGQSRYDIKSERGTIIKLSSDFKTREILGTGLRWPVALAINQHGDLFCADQEGATWLANGNPFDELIHVQKGRHYGFPPRHPKYLPNVIDEPNVFDYAPQHQSICGVHFNDVGPEGRFFGPWSWRGDAILTGESRGKIWRTKLAKTAAGYVAQNQLIARLSMLTIDAVPSPRGDLAVTCHSGAPDWGTGPDGEGKLYNIRFRYTNAPQPALAWNASPTELRIAFDRPLDPAEWRNLARSTKITLGRYVSAGDQFETLRPGYRVVQEELATPRYEIPVLSASLSSDRRSVSLLSAARHAAVNYAVTLPRSAGPASKDELPQHAAIDLVTDLSGVETEWAGSGTNWTGWLPHLELAVSKEFTLASAEHDRLWQHLETPGSLKMRAQLNLWQMLRAPTQPGSQLDFEYPPETITVTFKANGKLNLKAPAARRVSDNEASLTVEPARDQWTPIEVTLATGATDSTIQRFNDLTTLRVSWHTAEDARPRALPLRRILAPWAKPHDPDPSEQTPRVIQEIAGGNWQRGREIYFSDRAACHKCHTVRGEGGTIAPDLSNLIHRDYASVMKDIQQPSAAINPDAVAYNVHLKDGDVLTGVPIREAPGEIVFGDVNGQPITIARDRIAETKPSGV